jgi:hypothetical protein
MSCRCKHWYVWLFEARFSICRSAADLTIERSHHTTVRKESFFKHMRDMHRIGDGTENSCR